MGWPLSESTPPPKKKAPEVKGSVFLLQVIAALQGKQRKKERNKHNKRIRFDYTFKNKQARYQRRNLKKAIGADAG